MTTTRSSVQVRGTELRYIEQGEGDPSYSSMARIQITVCGTVLAKPLRGVTALLR